MDMFKPADAVRETGLSIHRYHRNGHKEKIYANALRNRLRAAGYQIEQQKTLVVRDEDGSILGESDTDLILNGCLLIEVKAVRTLLDEHIAQVLGYLRSTGLTSAAPNSRSGSSFSPLTASRPTTSTRHIDVIRRSPDATIGPLLCLLRLFVAKNQAALRRRNATTAVSAAPTAKATPAGSGTATTVASMVIR